MTIWVYRQLIVLEPQPSQSNEWPEGLRQHDELVIPEPQPQSDELPKGLGKRDQLVDLSEDCPGSPTTAVQRVTRRGLATGPGGFAVS